MRPGYKDRYEQYPKPQVTTAIRVSDSLKQEIEVYAEAEGDTLTGLIREGILRVLDDRRQDSNYLKNLSTQGVNTLSELAVAMRLRKQIFTTESVEVSNAVRAADPQRAAFEAPDSFA